MPFFFFSFCGSFFPPIENAEIVEINLLLEKVPVITLVERVTGGGQVPSVSYLCVSQPLNFQYGVGCTSTGNPHLPDGDPGG